MENNYFKTLDTVNVSEKIKKKGDLSYLSWAWAWRELKTIYPDSTYKIYERDQEIITTEVTEYEKQVADIEAGTQEQPKSTVTVEKRTVIPVNYFTDGRTAWVKVGVTVNNIEHIETLAIMNNKNAAVAVSTVTSTMVGKAIQRALTKAIARHGLGIYIYAGEDLPADDQDVIPAQDNESFNSLKQEVITLITSMFDSKHEAEVDSYIRQNFGDVRISQTTPDFEPQLLAAKEYLTQLQDE